MKVMIAVTHLLGTGHLSRALTLGHAFRRDGHTVFVVSGGMPAPQLNSNGIELLGLPPLRSDGTNFTRLLTEGGEVADAGYLQARAAALEAAVRDFAPDVLITELFPFGRRVLAEEFESLLEAAHSLPRRPVVLSSIRDILAPPSKPAKVTRADEILERYYDGVLVHSDPGTTTLDASWPVSDRLAEKLHYTGYVAPNPAGHHPDKSGEGEILVSAGGGSVGDPIFHAAIEAARKMTSSRWRLLVGGQDAKVRITRFQAMAEGAPVIIEPVRPDFRQMLYHAAASISMCGYNTVLDILQSGAPAVFIPFDDGQEVEQGLRARSLSHMPGIDVVTSARLTGENLVQAVGQVVSDSARDASGLSFDGADRSVGIAKQLLEAQG